MTRSALMSSCVRSSNKCMLMPGLVAVVLTVCGDVLIETVGVGEKVGSGAGVFVCSGAIITLGVFVGMGVLLEVGVFVCTGMTTTVKGSTVGVLVGTGV